MNTRSNASRRLFLKQAAALSSLGAAGAPLAFNLAAMGSAAAQSATGYKAIVCLFMFGGNDSLNMVLRTDGPSWDNYTAVRNQLPESIALLAPGEGVKMGEPPGTPRRLGGVKELNYRGGSGETLALHPLMEALVPLFDTERRLAIMANIGTLVEPMTQNQWFQQTPIVPRPPSLFSHNDQQNYWQSFQTEGAQIGWGGRMAELIAPPNVDSQFTAISAAGNAVWLAGRELQQYQVGSGGTIRIGSGADSEAFQAAMHQIARTARSAHPMEMDLASIAGRSIDSEKKLREALEPAGEPPFTESLLYTDPLSGLLTVNPLAQQLQIVARLIQAGMSGKVSVRRQVFFVSMGGFDTHDNQNRAHAGLMARLAHALKYFDDTLGAIDALGGIGSRQNVTLFTASDFGRTFTSNGDGTDHGWGAHHFVMGGAVRGGHVYGTLPVLGRYDQDVPRHFVMPTDTDDNRHIQNGSLIPTTSVQQLGATLARWFGVPSSQMLGLYPGLENLGPQDLGFLP